MTAHPGPALRRAALLVAVACGGGSGPDGADTYSIPETTKVLDPASLAALDAVSDDLATFTFSRSTPLLDDLAAGDVLVSDVHAPLLPVGALRRVQAVERAGSVVVTTAPASLGDAIERGSIRRTIEIRDDDVVGARTRPGVARSVGPTGLYFGLNDVVLFDGDGGGGAGDQVVMNGTIAIEPDLELVIDLDGFSVAEASVALVGEVSGNVNIDARREAVLPGDPITLASIDLAPITFFVGPVPVVITSEIALQVGASGVVTARMNVGFQTDAEARIGFGYKDGDFGDISEITTTADLEIESFDDGVVGAARLFAGPRLSVGLYGIDVGFATLMAFVQADVDAGADPWWCLSAGVEGRAGLDVSIDFNILWFEIEIDLVDYTTDPIGDSVELGCAPGPAPSSAPGGGGDDDVVQTYATSFGGDNIDAINAVLATDDGGAILAGATNSFSPTPIDGWLVKVDALGHIAWQTAYQDVHGATGVIAMDGGYLVTAGQLGATVEAVRLLRVDRNGTLLWARSYTGPQGVGPARVVKAEDGGFLVAGTRGIAAAADFFAARFDPGGELLWARTYGGADGDELSAAVATSDGGFLLAGQTSSFGVTFTGTWVVKLDADGGVEWQRLFDPGGNFVGTIALESAMGGYLVGGHEVGAGLLVRMTGAGEVTWARRYDAGTANDYMMDAAAYPDGSFGVVGSVGLGADADLWVTRLSDDGSVLWSRAIGGADHESAGGNPPDDRAGAPVQVTADGGLLVAGQTRTFGPGAGDAWLLKLSRNGFLAVHPEGPATAASLTGDLVELDLSGAATDVEPAALALVEEPIEVDLVSTRAAASRQGGLP